MALFLTHGLAQAAEPDVPPFFAVEGTALTPEIGVMNSGIMQDVKHVWRPDPRYVMISVGGGGAGSLGLEEFSSQPLPRLGIVGIRDEEGDPAPAGAAGRHGGRQGGQGGQGAALPKKLPSQILRECAPTVLDRKGMTRLGS